MIPEYIVNAAMEYMAKHGGDKVIYDAFIAGHKATREPKSKNVVLTESQERAFDEAWKMYRRKGNKGKAKKEWLELKETDYPNVIQHIQSYVASREINWQQDFEGYINQRLFESPVYRGSELLFDPIQMEIPSVYAPKTDGVFQWWDDKEKCLHFNGYIDMVDDGYTADNRPDGAKLKWQMYTWIWSASKKDWIKQ